MLPSADVPSAHAEEVSLTHFPSQALLVGGVVGATVSGFTGRLQTAAAAAAVRRRQDPLL